MKQKEYISLNGLHKENPYTVPENYFETLPTIIQGKAINKNKFENLKILKFSIAISSISAIIIFAIWFNSTSSDVFTSNELLSQVNEKQLVAYLYDSQLDEEEFITDLEIDWELNNNIISNTYIENQSLKEYEENYLLEQYDYEDYNY